MARNSALHTFFMQFAKAAIAAFTVILLSRWMGAEGRGELGVLLFYVNLFMVFNEYVGGSSLGNYAAKYSLKRLLPVAWLWALGTFIGGAILLFLWTGSSEVVFYTLTMAVPLAFLTIQYNIYQGRAQVYLRNKLQLLLESLKLVLVVLLALVAQFSHTQQPVPSLFDTLKLLKPQEVGLSYSVATTLVLFIALLFWLPKWLKSTHKFAIEKPPKGLVIHGFWAQNGQLVQFLNYRLSLILLTWLLGTTTAAGVYANALLIADTIWIFGNSYGTIAHMRILQSENPVFRADLTLRYSVIALAGTALAVLCMSLVPNALYVGVFGPEFAELKSTAMWLIPAILALGASTLFSHYLHATNQFKTLLLANVCGLTIQIVLALILIPKMGLKGACIAADAGFVVILVIVFGIFQKQNPQSRLHGVFRLKTVLRMLWN